MSKKETIASKVKALLEKAESSEHEAEASSFNAKAQELMEKYQLEQADIRDADRAPVISRQFRYSNTDANIPGKKQLVGVACEISGVFCVFFRGTRHGGVASLWGTEENLDMAELLYSSFLVQATRLAGLAYKEQNGGLGRKTFFTSYFVGFGSGIADRKRPTKSNLIELSRGEEAAEQFFGGFTQGKGHRTNAAAGAGRRGAQDADVGDAKLKQQKQLGA